MGRGRGETDPSHEFWWRRPDQGVQRVQANVVEHNWNGLLLEENLSKIRHYQPKSNCKHFVYLLKLWFLWRWFCSQLRAPTISRPATTPPGPWCMGGKGWTPSSARITSWRQSCFYFDSYFSSVGRFGWHSRNFKSQNGYTESYTESRKWKFQIWFVFFVSKCVFSKAKPLKAPHLQTKNSLTLPATSEEAAWNC